MAEAWIIDAVRTPRGRGKPGRGALSGVHPQELLAQTLNQLAVRTGIDLREVDDVVIGTVSQAGEQGANLARNAVLCADWPLEVSAVSLNRFCGSGLQAVNFAAMGVTSGAQQLVVAGGVTSMSRVPMGSDGAGADGGNERERAGRRPLGSQRGLCRRRASGDEKPRAGPGDAQRERRRHRLRAPARRNRRHAAFGGAR